jgi:Tfp pilus assembly protein FimT
MIGSVASPRRRYAPGSRPAFTLFELIGVLVVLGVLSATAIPAISTITRAKVEAARAEVAFALVFARETAASTGVPTGVRIDVGSQEMSYVHILTPGDPPSVMTNASGEARESVVIDRNGAAAVEEVTGAGSGAAAGTVWFGHAGVPEKRAVDGSYLQDAPSDISISFTTGDPLTVHAHTGVVE